MEHFDAVHREVLKVPLFAQRRGVRTVKHSPPSRETGAREEACRIDDLQM